MHIVAWADAEATNQNLPHTSNRNRQTSHSHESRIITDICARDARSREAWKERRGQERGRRWRRAAGHQKCDGRGGRERQGRLGLDELDEVGGGHALGLEDLVARGGEAERVDAEHLVGVLVPGGGDAGLDGGGLGLHRLGQHSLVVRGVLRLKQLDARHRDDAVALSELGGSLDAHRELRADGEDDALELALLLLGHVAALERAGALLGRGARVDDRQVLARQDERGGARLAGDGVGVRSRRLLGVTGAHHVQVGHAAQAGNNLDRLVGRAVLAHADGVVRPDVGDGQVREGSHADRAHHVARKDEEGGARRAVQAVKADAVEDGAHRVLADPVIKVAAGVVGLGEVAHALEVVLV
mmetsp:Transcript_12885/g.42137  ORF Transcript_12885/g.42137 Transcript_12885/m.42137 type:complete len:357 (-) Transcript_12885:1347-2417(-)